MQGRNLNLPIMALHQNGGVLMKKSAAILGVAVSLAIFSGSVVAQSLGSAAGVHFKTNTGIGTIKIFSESHKHCIQEAMRTKENVKRLGYEYLGVSSCQKSFAAREVDIRAFDGSPLPLPFDVITVVDGTFGPAPWPWPILKPRPFPFPFPWPGPICLSCPPPGVDLGQMTYVYENHAEQFRKAFEKYNIAEYQERLDNLRSEYDLEGFDRTVLDVQSKIFQ